MSNPCTATADGEPSIKSDMQSTHSTTPLLPAAMTDSAEKPSSGVKALWQKLKDEDKERKAGRIEHISYEEADKRTGYDQSGFPNQEKQVEKEKLEGKGDKRALSSLFLV